MKHKLLSVGLLLTAMLTVNQIFSQNIGINATGASPAASAGLDVNFTNKGLLIPRVALTATNAAGPIAAPATSLLVYNTATAGAAPNNVLPGYYYWDGLVWVALGGSGGKDWSLLGNAGTDPAINFVGTTDAQHLQFRTNNTNRMRIEAGGNVGIGTTAPTALLEVSSGAASDGIYGHSNQCGGYLGRETNISFGTPVQTLSGSGVYAANPTAGYTSMYAQSTGAADVAASISFSNVWMAQYCMVDNASAGFNPSVSYNQLNVTNSTLGGFQKALRGFNNRAALAGNPGYSVGTEGLAYSQNQDALGVTGFAYSNAGTKAGGYFEALTYAGASNAYAYVGARVAGTNRKIVGTGSVSEIIPTKNHGRITLTCPESPEYWYQDYGTVNLVDGKAHVDLDPILVDIIFVNDKHPIRVFCTPVDMLNFNGVAVVNRTETGFDLVELNGGTNSGIIDYQLIVKPRTNYGEGRFPQAPAIWIKSDEEPVSAKAKNQPNDGREIFNWPPDAVVYGYEELARKRALEHSTPANVSNTPK